MADAVPGQRLRFQTDTVYFPSSPRWSSVYLLQRRQIETHYGASDRLGALVARNRVLSPGTALEPTWSRSSKQQVCFGMDRRFHMDHHSKCYFIDGFPVSAPRLLYQLPPAPAKHRVSTLMQYFMHVKPGCCSEEETSVISLALREDGYLLVMNADTGSVLRSICLSLTVKYLRLTWAEYLYSVQVKSVHHPQLPEGLRHDKRLLCQASELVRFVILEVHPVRLKASFKIDKKVFGWEVKDASVEGDILLLYLGSKKVCRIYNLKELIKKTTVRKLRLWDQVEDKIVGKSPLGIPLTMDITEIPVCLLEASTGMNGTISFGGCPFHYLHSSKQNANLFALRSLRSRRLVHEFNSQELSLNSDLVEFHFEDNQRLFQIVGGKLSCYYLSVQDEVSTVHPCYTIEFDKMYGDKQKCPVVTRSGRKVKEIEHHNVVSSQQCLIHEVDYENELDLAYAVVTFTEKMSAFTKIVFFDDWNGRVLKMGSLPTWNEDGTNSLHFELGSLLHQTSPGNGRAFQCSLYKLVG